MANNPTTVHASVQTTITGSEISEALLQFIWQFQYYNKGSLKTASGEDLQVILPGKLNRNQGPDFLNAQIRIGSTLFAGSVELHLFTSQWLEHKHEADTNYKNVILHVVYQHDVAVNEIPVLELQPRISALLLERYRTLMQAPSFIPCANSLKGVKEIIWTSWKERLLAERLTRKAAAVQEILQGNNFHWENTFWILLARNFGVKVNQDVFEAMARSIPVTLLAKHKNQLIQLEALLMGQAGLLQGEFSEAYPKMLQKEFNFLQTKYKLPPVHMPVHFLRMRPSNFPTVRLAQLAALVQQSSHLFSKVIDAEQVSEIQDLFRITANDYWHYHYRFDEETVYKKKNIGKDMSNNLLINTIIPVLFAYGLYHKNESYKLKAITWLQQLQPEHNHITKGFASLDIAHQSAYDSQALIELKSHYCDERHCLSCAIGNSLLRS